MCRRQDVSCEEKPTELTNRYGTGVGYVKRGTTLAFVLVLHHCGVVSIITVSYFPFECDTGRDGEGCVWSNQFNFVGRILVVVLPA